MKTIFIVIAIFCLSIASGFGADFAAKPKTEKSSRSAITEPLFQGGADSLFVDWVAEKIGFPAILDAASITNGEAFWVYFKVDEAGKVVDVADPKKARSQLDFLVRATLPTSPDWTPAYDGKKPQEIGYNLFVRPVERTLRLLKDEDCVQVMPTFQGGDIMAFRNWVMDNLVYPEAVMKRNITGRVVVQFVVERDGSVTIVDFPELGWRELGYEVARVVGMSPKWTPGSVEGIPASVAYTLPVDFKL